nr:SAM-dependent methyltransferase [Croceicoccus bisphenolivorans]
MAEANAHYYSARDPLGAKGDFITAPEISQMFGEMIGGWLADLRARAGGNAGAQDAAYVELGPGRGTLARDALRVLAMAGGAAQVHLVEGSPALRAEQARLLPDARFHDDIASLPDDRPLLVVANEFFDALPVRQLVRTASGWRERMVGLEDDRLVPVSGDRPMDAAVPQRLADAAEGAILETCPAASAIMRELASRVARQGGAILAIDYGYAELAHGSTFQAVARHERADPFAAPGTADLTAHVDFGALADAARGSGLRVDGITAQGAFLMALGMGYRAAALARANPQGAEDVFAALQRLTAPDAMGSLFKVIAAVHPAWPESAGFAVAETG